MRSTGICACIGGDEFVAICIQLEQQDQVDAIATKLLSKLSSVLAVAGNEYVLGASIGISLYPLHGDTLPQLMSCANKAMYQIKRNGKSGYQIYAPTSATEIGQLSADVAQ